MLHGNLLISFVEITPESNKCNSTKPEMGRKTPILTRTTAERSGRSLGKGNAAYDSRLRERFTSLFRARREAARRRSTGSRSRTWCRRPWRWKLCRGAATCWARRPGSSRRLPRAAPWWAPSWCATRWPRPTAACRRCYPARLLRQRKPGVHRYSTHGFQRQSSRRDVTATGSAVASSKRFAAAQSSFDVSQRSKGIAFLKSKFLAITTSMIF